MDFLNACNARKKRPVHESKEACSCGCLRVKTLYAPQNYCHKNINFAFGFFGICGHHILDYLCLFEVYYISFRLELVYLKKYSNKHLQT